MMRTRNTHIQVFVMWPMYRVHMNVSFHIICMHSTQTGVWVLGGHSVKMWPIHNGSLVVLGPSSMLEEEESDDDHKEEDSSRYTNHQWKI